MVAGLRKHLMKVLALVAGKERALKVAQHRWLMNHVRAVANHRAGEKSWREAKRAKDPAKKKSIAARAKRQGGRARNAHARATWWVDRAKELTQSIHDLKIDQEEITKEIRESGVQVDFENNRVTGGTIKQRLAVAMHVSMAKAVEYYSQIGTWSAHFFLTGPPPGYHYDCSSWFISGYWTVGGPDPSGNNFNGGWTGPMGEHGKEISEADLDTGDAILFGYAPYFHVEMKDGPMSRSPWTGGHGSEKVDRGSVTLLPGPRAFRRYI